MNVFTLRVACVFFILAVAGCTTSERYAFYHESAPFTPTNVYKKSDYLPDEVKRVVLLPIYTQAIEGTLLNELDHVFYTELLKMNRFETVLVTRDFLREHFSVLQVASTEALPAHFIQKLLDIVDSDAVLFLDLTTYRPYMPISIGVRAKLAQKQGGDIVWAFDDVFDSGEPSVAAAASLFQNENYRLGYPADLANSILKSPLWFSKYVAHNVFCSLPQKIEENI